LGPIKRIWFDNGDTYVKVTINKYMNTCAYIDIEVNFNGT